MGASAALVLWLAASGPVLGGEPPALREAFLEGAFQDGWRAVRKVKPDRRRFRFFRTADFGWLCRNGLGKTGYNAFVLTELLITRRADCTGLPGEVLERLDLDGTDLRGSDLRAARLDGTLLRGSDLYGANISSASLRGADLSRAVLGQVYARGADLRDAVLDEADLTAADLRGARLGRARLRGATILVADLAGASLAGADLRGADLTAAQLDGVDLSGALFDEAAELPFDSDEARRRGMVLREPS